MRFDYYAIIPHTSEPRVFLLSGPDGWSLPHFGRAERHWWQVVGNQALREELGINVTVLRCLSNAHESKTERVVRVYYEKEPLLPIGGPL